jgi:thiosulfate/3-mercaptopyruvate sulfurtransferase
MTALVSTAWLADHLDDPAVRVLDASWTMPASGRDVESEFLDGHIPNATRFDHDAASEPHATLSHTLATPEHFSSYAGKLGLLPDQTIVIYDSGGFSPSARAWWLFKTFGHDDVRVLDGGLAAWKAEGYELQRGAGRVAALPTHFPARLDERRVRGRAAVRRASEEGVTIVDARPAARFRGEAPEPRPDLPRGHIPGSRNVPSTDLVDAAGRFKVHAEIREAFGRQDVDHARPVICTCGSGVTACVLAFALEELGNREVAVYDGSWSDWASHPDIATEQRRRA